MIGSMVHSCVIYLDEGIRRVDQSLKQQVPYHISMFNFRVTRQDDVR